MWRATLLRLWRSLPYDGQGLFPPADAPLRDLRRRAASNFWKRTPWWSRPLLIPMARLGWVGACIGHVWRYAPPPRKAPRLFVDCLRSGARPNEALIWRQFFPPPSPHPLPGRAAGRLLSQLGSAAEHRLLADKQAAAELLAKAGLPVPPLLEIIPRGTTIDPAGQVWSQPAHLFVKPRHGWGSRGAMAVEVLLPNVYRIDGGPPVSDDLLRAALAATSLGQRDDLLVQARLFAAPELADLATSGVAPVLRLTTARNPGEAPFLHSALLSTEVPGERARHFIRGQIRSPVNLATGRIGHGIWFLQPGERYSRLPWNQAPLADRPMPGLDCAVEMALRAMALFPGLPLVNWDLIVTHSGPVILEGNTGGDWTLTNLSTLQGLDTIPLVPLLRRWSADPPSGKQLLKKSKTNRAADKRR
jgi:hypothetical protein